MQLIQRPHRHPIIQPGLPDQGVGTEFSPFSAFGQFAQADRTNLLVIDRDVPFQTFWFSFSQQAGMVGLPRQVWLVPQNRRFLLVNSGYLSALDGF